MPTEPRLPQVNSKAFDSPPVKARSPAMPQGYPDRAITELIVALGLDMPNGVSPHERKLHR